MFFFEQPSVYIYIYIYIIYKYILIGSYIHIYVCMCIYRFSIYTLYASVSKFYFPIAQFLIWGFLRSCLLLPVLFPSVPVLFVWQCRRSLVCAMPMLVLVVYMYIPLSLYIYIYINLFCFCFLVYLPSQISSRRRHPSFIFGAFPL